ncbi:MAG: hemolysin family protein [Salibacteraceae bacterium]
MADSSIFIAIISVLISLVLSAFYSGMEIAFVSSNRLKIELDKKLGLYQGRVYSYFHKHQSKFISTLLLGNNIALVVYGIFMAQLLERPFLRMLSSIPNELTIQVLLLLLQTLVSTAIILVFAEFLPKILFRINPNKKLEIFTVPAMMLCMPLYVFVWALFALLGYVLRLFSIPFEESEYALGRVDLDHFVKEVASTSNEESELDNELQIFQNALDFSSIKARECMIPRNEIEALDFEDSVEKLNRKFIDTGYSKILIYKESIDNVIGYAHSFELFQKPSAIKNILRPLAIIPETATADKVLKILIEQKKHVALVVDEYGGTSGMLTLEDIVEEIFGEIEDEHDQEELVEERINKDEFSFSARLEIDYLNDQYELNLPVSEEYETLAGLIIEVNEDLPNEGDSIDIGDYTFDITKVSDRKIEQVQLRPFERAN